MTEMKRDSFEKHSGIGEVQIANEVVASIAGISAAEIEGVEAMAGGFANELAGRFGAKNLSKGVKVEVQDGTAVVELAIVMKYGYNIPTVCGQIQEKVKSAIETMTGLTVADVNIRIAGVVMGN